MILGKNSLLDDLGAVSYEPAGTYMKTGRRDDYRWLTTDLELEPFINAHPWVVLGKRIAITSIDSGAPNISECQVLNGWKCVEGIVYSPRIDDIRQIQDVWRGFDELYVFEETVTPLGTPISGNLFDAHLRPGQLARFVNYYGCLFDLEDLSELFWTQMKWVRADSYLNDGSECLAFASRDIDSFVRVEESLLRFPTGAGEP